jgi:hypothetical protein
LGYIHSLKTLSAANYNVYGAIMEVFYDVYQDQFQLLDYVFAIEERLLVMLPHGSEDGRMFNRASQEVSEDFVLKIAAGLVAYMAEKFDINKEEISIAAAPCYPVALRQNVNHLDILGDWNTPTWAEMDSIDMAFVIKSWHCTVRRGYNNC